MPFIDEGRAAEAKLEYQRALTVIRTLVRTYGQPGASPEQPMMEFRDIMHTLALAQGMMLAADNRLETPRQMREMSELMTNTSREYAAGLRSAFSDFTEAFADHLDMLTVSTQ